MTGPHCSPTRAGLLTGRYQQRFGHEANAGAGAGPNAGLPTNETTMADRLKAAGYRTALFGKWHLGATERLHPMSRGFDEYYGFLGGDHSYFESSPNGRNPLYEGRTSVEASGYLTDVLTDRAVAFIKREKSHPFFSISPTTRFIRRCTPPRSIWRGSRVSPTSSAAPMPR